MSVTTSLFKYSRLFNRWFAVVVTARVFSQNEIHSRAREKVCTCHDLKTNGWKK